MKSINITFEDDEFLNLVKLKDGRSWHDFILMLINQKEAENDSA